MLINIVLCFIITMIILLLSCNKYVRWNRKRIAEWIRSEHDINPYLIPLFFCSSDDLITFSLIEGIYDKDIQSIVCYLRGE